MLSFIFLANFIINVKTNYQQTMFVQLKLLKTTELGGCQLIFIHLCNDKDKDTMLLWWFVMFNRYEYSSLEPLQSTVTTVQKLKY